MMLVTFAVAVVLGASSVLGDCLIQCPPTCKTIWTPFENQHVVGLEKKDDYTTEEDCKKACADNPDCWNIDWNYGESSGFYHGCWFGSEKNPPGKLYDATVNHYDKRVECSEGCNIANIWTPFLKQQVKGLAKQKDITTEEDCKTACAESSTCWNIDWNFYNTSYHGCWHGSVKNPPVKVPDQNVNHYDLDRQCA